MANWNKRPTDVSIIDWALSRGVRTESGCLVSPGGKNGPRNYPTVRNEDGRTVRLTKYVFEHAHRVLEEGEQVLHRCDNPPCYEPEHLFAGTILDNMRDRSEKGREYHAVRDENPRSKLTQAQAAVIQAEYAQGATQCELAERHGVHQTTISRIIRVTVDTPPGLV